MTNFKVIVSIFFILFQRFVIYFTTFSSFGRRVVVSEKKKVLGRLDRRWRLFRTCHAILTTYVIIILFGGPQKRQIWACNCPSRSHNFDVVEVTKGIAKA